MLKVADDQTMGVGTPARDSDTVASYPAWIEDGGVVDADEDAVIDDFVEAFGLRGGLI